MLNVSMSLLRREAVFRRGAEEDASPAEGASVLGMLVHGKIPFLFREVLTQPPVAGSGVAFHAFYAGEA